MSTTSQLKWPHQDEASLNAFYGSPHGWNGLASPAWAAANLVKWVPPYPIYYSGNLKKPLSHLMVHKKTLPVFQAAFTDVLKELGIDYIKAHRLNISGGTFCYRLERGGSRLSVHSWGCAIDMDPQHNPFPHSYNAGLGMLDAKFAGILERHGFTWRGAAGDNDAMHLQLSHRK